MTEQNEIVLYRPDETLSLDVRVAEETVWLSQQQMADLFGVNRQAVTKHLKNIYETAELNQGATCSILELVQKEGNRMVKREVAFYNLDAIEEVLTSHLWFICGHSRESKLPPILRAHLPSVPRA